jgi:hypothetical protein
MISNPWLRGTLVAGLIAGAISLSLPLQSIPNRLDNIDLSQEAICTEVWGTQDYRPIYSEAPFWRGSEAPEEPGVLSPCPTAYDAAPMTDLRVSEITRNGTDWHFQVSANSETSISISQFFFPGWIASENGNQLVIEPNRESGTIQLNIPKDTSNVTLNLIETNLRSTANSLTLLTIAGLLGAVGFLGYKEIHSRR